MRKPRQAFLDILLWLLYNNQDKFDAAEQMYERALRGYEKALSADNVMTDLLELKLSRASVLFFNFNLI
jgi:hypothetical protein